MPSGVRGISNVGSLAKNENLPSHSARLDIRGTKTVVCKFVSPLNAHTLPVPGCLFVSSRLTDSTFLDAVDATVQTANHQQLQWRVHQVATEFQDNATKIRERHLRTLIDRLFRAERSLSCVERGNETLARQCRRSSHGQSQSEHTPHGDTRPRCLQFIRRIGSSGKSIALFDDQCFQRSRCR